jgi:hypothetical protein
MKKVKNNLHFWLISVIIGLYFAYSISFHWFGFLQESKINRLSLILLFGGLCSFIAYFFIRWGFKFLHELVTPKWIKLVSGIALAGALVLTFVLSFSFTKLQTQSSEVISRFWLVGLYFSDFLSLASLLFALGLISIFIITRKYDLARIPRFFPLIFPLPLILLICILFNLVHASNDQLSTINQLIRLPSNSLIGLDQGSRTFKENIRVDAVFFKHYAGWTLIAPKDLLLDLKLNRDGTLLRWGRIASITFAAYPFELSDDEMNDLLSRPSEKVENGLGQRYVAILENDPNHQVCLRVKADLIFIVPVSLSPVCQFR